MARKVRAVLALRMLELLLTNAAVATMADDRAFGLVRDGAVGCSGVGWNSILPVSPGQRMLSHSTSSRWRTW